MRRAEAGPATGAVASPRGWPRWAIALAWLLAALHAAAALGKLLDLPGFAAVLSDYRLLPAALTGPAAAGIVSAEVAIAMGLVAPAARRAAALGAAALAALNGAALTATLLRGIALANCGCFGVFLARPLTVFSPLEDVGLLAAATAIAVAAPRVRLDPARPRPA